MVVCKMYESTTQQRSTLYISMVVCKRMNLQHRNNGQRYIYQCLCVNRMNLQHNNNDQRYISMVVCKTYESTTHQQ